MRKGRGKVSIEKNQRTQKPITQQIKREWEGAVRESMGRQEAKRPWRGPPGGGGKRRETTLMWGDAAKKKVN